ncbi:hypothetical protein ABIC65_004476 [Sphingomonas trueperi]|uniref:hypothetical protein n=1 Tax=Sphingomonas trueperi TaxID=53317 RepID=UPI0033971C76
MTKTAIQTVKLSAGDFEVRSQRGGPAVSGEIILHTDKCYVQLSLGLCGLDREVLYRTCRGRATSWAAATTSRASTRSWIPTVRTAARSRASAG